MVAFIVVIFCFWLLWKFLRWWTIRKLQQHARGMYDQFYGAQAGQDTRRSSSPRQKKSGWNYAKPAKKIYRDEGEYVEWEDVKATVSETEAADSTYRTYRSTTIVDDQQIVDAEWEDIN